VATRWRIPTLLVVAALLTGGCGGLPGLLPVSTHRQADASANAEPESAKPTQRPPLDEKTWFQLRQLMAKLGARDADALMKAVSAADPAKVPDLLKVWERMAAILPKLMAEDRADLIKMVQDSDVDHVPYILRVWEMGLAKRTTTPEARTPAASPPAEPARAGSEGTRPVRPAGVSPTGVETAARPPSTERPRVLPTSGTDSPGGLHPNTPVSLTGEPSVRFTATGRKEDFNSRLAALTAMAEARARQNPGDLRSEFHARLLQLIAGDREKVAAPFPALESGDQEFCRDVLWGLFDYLNTKEFADSEDRATMAVEKIGEALQNLRTQAELVVGNAAFCEKVVRFGKYTPQADIVFTPGAKSLIYCELDNVRNEPADGEQFRTLIGISVAVYDEQRRKVRSYPQETAEYLCRRPMTDYFLSYKFAMPTNMDAGPHVLKIMVEDKLAGKVGEARIPFTVK